MNKSYGQGYKPRYSQTGAYGSVANRTTVEKEFTLGLKRSSGWHQRSISTTVTLRSREVKLEFFSFSVELNTPPAIVPILAPLPLFYDFATSPDTL